MSHYFKVPLKYLKRAVGTEIGHVGDYSITDDVHEWLDERGNYDLVSDPRSGLCVVIHEDNLALEFMLAWG